MAAGCGVQRRCGECLWRSSGVQGAADCVWCLEDGICAGVNASGALLSPGCGRPLTAGDAAFGDCPELRCPIARLAPISVYACETYTAATLAVHVVLMSAAAVAALWVAAVRQRPWRYPAAREEARRRWAGSRRCCGAAAAAEPPAPDTGSRSRCTYPGECLAPSGERCAWCTVGRLAFAPVLVTMATGLAAICATLFFSVPRQCGAPFALITAAAGPAAAALWAAAARGRFRKEPARGWDPYYIRTALMLRGRALSAVCGPLPDYAAAQCPLQAAPLSVPQEQGAPREQRGQMPMLDPRPSFWGGVYQRLAPLAARLSSGNISVPQTSPQRSPEPDDRGASAPPLPSPAARAAPAGSGLTVGIDRESDTGASLFSQEQSDRSPGSPQPSGLAEATRDAALAEVDLPVAFLGALRGHLRTDERVVWWERPSRRAILLHGRYFAERCVIVMLWAAVPFAMAMDPPLVHRIGVGRGALAAVGAFCFLSAALVLALFAGSLSRAYVLTTRRCWTFSRGLLGGVYAAGYPTRKVCCALSLCYRECGTPVRTLSWQQPPDSAAQTASLGPAQYTCVRDLNGLLARFVEVCPPLSVRAWDSAEAAARGTWKLYMGLATAGAVVSAVPLCHPELVPSAPYWAHYLCVLAFASSVVRQGLREHSVTWLPHESAKRWARWRKPRWAGMQVEQRRRSAQEMEDIYEAVHGRVGAAQGASPPAPPLPPGAAGPALAPIGRLPPPLSPESPAPGPTAVCV
eukprot:TRINITY_DN28930_c0_g1_i1.p1 TRINITY_DN28930_c0_g1~~TRINITY_DN28930_c0_g1_i1.p1  ORF type:complete len:773 (+),score=190.82 TRINITY_DN28930_c0_g1_i1:77-2320(+)